MAEISLTLAVGASEPFTLNPGRHVVVLAGEFNGGAVALQREVKHADEPQNCVWAADRGTAPMTSPGVVEVPIGKAAAGRFRFAVKPGATPPKIVAIVSLGVTVPAGA